MDSNTNQTLQTYETLFPTYNSSSSETVNYNPIVVSSITLADGTAYRFTYTSYGDVASITLPTGGKVTYQWDTSLGSSCLAQPTFCVQHYEDSFSGNPMGVVFRRLLGRKEMANGSTVTRQTSYSYLLDDTNNVTVTTVTDQDGSGNTLSFVKHHYLGNAADTGDLLPPPSRWYSTPQNGKENLTEFIDGTATTQQVQQNWAQRPCSASENCWFKDQTNIATATFPHDPSISSSQTTRGSAVKKTAYLYDVNNNVTDQSDYDWDNATMLRHSHTDYNQSFTNILNLPSETKLYDGSGALMADTQYTYDGSSPSPASGIVGHDPNYSGNQARGNLTTVRQCVNVTTGCNWTSATSTLPTTSAYDIAGNVTSVTDPRGHITTYTYTDPQNTYAHVTKLVDAIGQTWNWTYDYYSGKLTNGTDQNLVSTLYSYADPQSAVVDPLDRVRVITKASKTSAEDTTNAIYTSPTEVNLYQGQNVSNDQNLRTQNIYDGFGRQLESRAYTGASSYRSTPQSYDALGRVGTSTDELGNKTRYLYDSLGRMKSLTTADAAVASTSYSGNVTTATDQASKQRNTTADGLGRITKVVEDPAGLNYTTSYKYDGLDDLISVAQSAQTRTFTYDSLKRLATSQNPESGNIKYTYDNNDNLATRVDANQTTTAYSYDSLNRILSKSYFPASVTPNVTYTYCNPTVCSLAYGFGHLQNVSTTAGNSTGYTAFSAAGRVLGQTQTIGSASYPFSYSYAPVGNLLQEVYPSSRQINFGYTYANLPQYMGGVYTAPGTKTAVSTTYVGWTGFDGFAEASRSLGSLGALVLIRQFNSREQVSSMTLHNWYHSDNSPNYVQFNVLYNYGTTHNSGNLLSVTANNSPGIVASPSLSLSPTITTSYTYDGVNRMSSVTDSSYARTMCYDAYGNGWVTASSGTTPLPGNAPQEPGATCPGSGAVSPYASASNRLTGVTYDNNGNELLFRGDTLGYDAENRITSVKTAAGAVVVSYQYDGDGRRISKTTPNGTTNYVYDALGRSVAEYVGGALSKEYVRFASSFISSNTDLVAVENAPGNGSPCSTCFVISDSLGSIRLMADSTGAAIARHDYLPFGEEALADGSRPSAAGFGAGDGDTQRFTGKERDAESGLDYFGTRYYGSALGRFTSADDGSDQDPGDPQSWDLYSYVRNNPLRNIDASGRDCITTSNQTSSGVTVTTERGGSAETCSATYVNGTVNTNSYQYNGTSLSYSFGNDTASGAGTIAFSKYSNDDWAPGSSNMLGAAQIGGSQALVNEFMKQAAIGAAAGVAGRVIGAGVDAFLAARAARAAAAAVDIANLSNKIVRQMASRGWTAQEIVETVQNGKSYSVLNKATGGAATEYVNPASGKFVVVDNATKQVLQVSGSGFSPNHLIP